MAREQHTPVGWLIGVGAAFLLLKLGQSLPKPAPRPSRAELEQQKAAARAQADRTGARRVRIIQEPDSPQR